MIVLADGVTARTTTLSSDNTSADFDNNDNGGHFPATLTRIDGHAVIMPGHWGRVKTLVADGARVRSGEEIMTLYNPTLDRERHTRQRDKKKARADFSTAAAKRRSDTIEARDKQQQQVLRAEEAWLDVQQLRADGALAVAHRQLDVEQAEAELARGSNT